MKQKKKEKFFVSFLKLSRLHADNNNHNDDNDYHHKLLLVCYNCFQQPFARVFPLTGWPVELFVCLNQEILVSVLTIVLAFKR